MAFVCVEFLTKCQLEIRDKTASCDLTCSRSYWERTYLSPNTSFFKENQKVLSADHNQWSWIWGNQKGVNKERTPWAWLCAVFPYLRNCQITSLALFFFSLNFHICTLLSHQMWWSLVNWCMRPWLLLTSPSDLETRGLTLMYLGEVKQTVTTKSSRQLKFVL